MSAARRATRAGRNLLIALLAGVVLILGMVIAYIAGRSTDAPLAAPSSHPTSDVPPVTPTKQEADGAPPTGCLGGQSIGNAMLLSAQRSAKRTSYGAVEVAAAFFRWTYRYPHPSASDVRAVRQVFVPRAASQAEQSLIADYRRHSNPSLGEVADGQEFALTTAGGRWTVRSTGSSDDQRVSVLAPLVVGDAVSATQTTAESFDMTWVTGQWRVAGVAKANPNQLAAGGTAFSAGC